MLLSNLRLTRFEGGWHVTFSAGGARSRSSSGRLHGGCTLMVLGVVLFRQVGVVPVDFELGDAGIGGENVAGEQVKVGVLRRIFLEKPKMTFL